MAEMTPADMSAVLGNGNGEWLWILIILFAFWGNGNRNDCASQGFVANEFTQRDIFNTNTSVLTSANETQKEIFNTKYDNGLQIAGIDKDILLGNANLNQNILLGNQTLTANMNECCCTLRQEASANTQKILDAINNGRIADLQYQLNQANTAVANAVQTQNILNSLGRFYTNPPVNPYTVYNGCGCNTI